MLAGIHEGNQLSGAEPGFREDGVIVQNQLEAGGAIERAEELQHHWKRVGKIIRAGNQPGVNACLLGAPRELNHLFQAGMGEAGNYGFRGRSVARCELHQLHTFLERQRGRLARAAANGVAVERWKEMIEKPQEAIEVDTVIAKWRRYDRQRSGDSQKDSSLFGY